MKTLLLLIFIFLNSGCAARDPESYILKNFQNSIVALTLPENENSGGTGFQMRAPSHKSIIVTNSHVCYMNETHLLSINKRHDEQLLRVLEISKESDLCIMEPLDGLPSLRIADYVDAYERIFILGHPYLKGLTVRSGFMVERQPVSVPLDGYPLDKCSGGKFAIKSIQNFFGMADACIMTVDSIATSVTIYPGNSGSPALNENGEIVGVFFAGDPKDTAASMIPLDVLKRFIANY